MSTTITLETFAAEQLERARERVEGYAGDLAKVLTALPVNSAALASATYHASRSALIASLWAEVVHRELNGAMLVAHDWMTPKLVNSAGVQVEMLKAEAAQQVLESLMGVGLLPPSAVRVAILGFSGLED